MEFINFFQQNLYYFVVAAFVLLLFKNRILSKIYSVHSIGVEDAFAMFKQPAKTLFLDIRTSWELEREARIKASTAIPLSELRDRLKEIESKAMDRKNHHSLPNRKWKSG